MSDQSLRDALETIARGGVPLGISPAQWAKDWLAAHPAEPVGVSDEAVEAAAKALRDRWTIFSSVGALAYQTASAALHAAAPLLGTRPQPTLDRSAAKASLTAAFLAFRERNGGCAEGPDCAACRSLAGDEAEVALSALGGAVRPLPTREQIVQVLHDEGAFCGNCDYEDWESCDDCQRVLGAYGKAVLNLIHNGGAE